MDDLSLKRKLAELPREIEPPAGAWPAIRAQLKAGAPMKGARTVRAPALRIAALLTLLAVAAGMLLLTRAEAGRWTLASVRDERPLVDGERIASGDGALRLTVGTIGTVDVDPHTEGRLVESSWSSHRFQLSRGAIHARIDAPPRLFVVETPAGVAVDLGCAYTLEVDSAGTSTILVTAGWVSFEYPGRSPALIPAGWRAVMRGGGRLGTPVRDGASPDLRTAVAAFDSTRSGDGVAAILASAERADAVTLWHLIGRTAEPQRAQIVDRLTGMVPLSGGVTREALMHTDPRAMELYWTALPGTLPIIPAWRQALWKAWLRVAG